MDRTQRLFSMVDASGNGLEIGPGYNPLFPKRDGHQVETLDHGTAAEIREKYRDDPSVDISRIEEVDHVWRGEPIAELVGKPGHYHYIVASHVIEHTTDLVGFLNDCQTLLKPEGILLLAVPDKRRCFDVLQPMTTTGAALQAHLEKRTRHPPGLVFDYVAYGMLRGGSSGWRAGSEAPLSFAGELAQAKQMFARAQTSVEYIDAHAWRFTPSSFRLLIRDLREIGASDLREKEFYESDIHEFYVSLSRTGSGCPYDRLALAKMAVIESQEVLLGDRGA